MHSPVAAQRRALIYRHRKDSWAFAQWLSLYEAARSLDRAEGVGWYTALRGYWRDRQQFLAQDGFKFHNKYRLLLCGPASRVPSEYRCRNPRICPWCWANEVSGHLYLALYALLTTQFDAAQSLLAEVHRAVAVRIPEGEVTDDRGIISDELTRFADLFLSEGRARRTGMVGQTIRAGELQDSWILHQRALIVLPDMTPKLPLEEKITPLSWAGSMVTYYDRMTSINAIRKVAAHAAGSTFAYPVEYLFCPAEDLMVLSSELYDQPNRRPFFRRYGKLRGMSRERRLDAQQSASGGSCR